MLDGLRRLRWCVVEQPQFVEAGAQRFSSEELSFGTALPRDDAKLDPHVLLASSVLPNTSPTRTTSWTRWPRPVRRRFLEPDARQ